MISLNEYMKRNKFFVFATLAKCAFISYLFIGIVYWNFDVVSWHWITRLICAFISLVYWSLAVNYAYTENVIKK